MNYSNICDKICTFFPDRVHKMMILQLFVYGSVVFVYPFLLPLQKKLTNHPLIHNFNNKQLKNTMFPLFNSHEQIKLPIKQKNTHHLFNSYKQLQTNQIRNKAEKHWAKNNTTVEFYATYLLSRGRPILPRCFFPKKVLNKYWICQKT